MTRLGDPNVLDPDVRRGLERYLRFAARFGETPAENLLARRAVVAEAARLAARERTPDSAVDIEEVVLSSAEDERQAPLRIRIYRRRERDQPVPAVLYLHGGGLVMGAPDHDDALLEQVATDVDCTVVAPAYRLAPEHPFPAALEDVWRTLQWMADGGAEEFGVDCGRLALYGRSAGGGLAAATSLRLREERLVGIRYQVLVYPMLDDRTGADMTPDHKVPGVWSKTDNVAAWDAYLSDVTGCRQWGCDAVPVAAAPARASDLRGLPPTYVEVAASDLFHDEDVTFARRLADAGVEVRLLEIPGTCHGFDALAPSADVSIAAVRDRHEALRSALHGCGRGEPQPLSQF